MNDILLNEILPRVEKPSRYLGNEMNSVHKCAGDVRFRICLFFPDLYELGLGNLGLHILYAILNDMEDVWAERGYTSAPDLEAILRERHLPLFMLESKDSLRAADMIGFTLQSELTYTNVLNALDMSGIPLRASDRGENDPLIFAGGPSAHNPEPMAPFMDFIVIGDGEEAVVEMVEVLRPLQGASRRARLEALAALEGFYVPALYPFETLADGAIVPKEDAPKIRKRLLRDLDAARFPVNYIVPFTQLVHDGVSLEVLRGCTHGCRFCQAGLVTRPVRERSLPRIASLMEETLSNTGLEAVSLVSLSTCDYSQPRALVRQAGAAAHADNVSVSLPSLRLDSFAVELADAVADVRRSGLTFAPEAATPRLRAVINKFIPDEDLLEMAAEAVRRGWTSIKTYFMIGLPTERDEDVIAIADLCLRTLETIRRISGRAMVRTGVSTFVPKPFTPFQWCAQIDLDETVRRQRLLADRFRRHGNIKFGRHNPESSFIEGLLSRADRRAADLIEAAWRHGARLESWEEQLNFKAWKKAIDEMGYDVEAQFAARDLDARLPWDHIDVLVSKDWLREENHRAMRLEHAQDCRAGKCHRCGVIDHERDLCKTMLKRQAAGRKAENDPEIDTPSPTPRAPRETRDPLQRIRFRIGRTGAARLLSHLEMQSAWIRILRRAAIPVAYSQGYHAHPKLSFSTASPLGEESEGDYMDVMLDQFRRPEEVLERLRATLPRDFRVYSAEDVPLRGPSLMSIVTGYDYTLFTNKEPETLRTAAAALLNADTFTVTRRAKARSKGLSRKERETIYIDVRNTLDRLEVEEMENGETAVHFSTTVVEGRYVKPRDLIPPLELDPIYTRILKRNTRLEK